MCHETLYLHCLETGSIVRDRVLYLGNKTAYVKESKS